MPDNSPLSILHLIADLAPETGGPPKACIEMASAVAKLGHSTRIMTTDFHPLNGRMSELEKLELKHSNSDIEIKFFPVQKPRFLKTSFELAKSLPQIMQSADLVHIHSMYLFHNIVGAAAARKSGVPYLIRPHSILDPFIRSRHKIIKALAYYLFERRNILGSAGLHFTTEDEKRLAKPFSDMATSFVVPLGLNTEDYTIACDTKRLGKMFPELGGDRYLLFLGRLNFKKNLPFLLEVFSALRDKFPDLRLVIAGPDSDRIREKLAKEANAMECSHVTHFMEFVSGEKKQLLLSGASLFLLPSFSENFGISVVEAMASGTPVVISPHVNIADEVEKSKAGSVIELVLPSWVEEIARLLRLSAGEQNQYSINARALVERKYSWESVAPKIISMYRSAISSRK